MAPPAPQNLNFSSLRYAKSVSHMKSPVIASILRPGTTVIFISPSSRLNEKLSTVFSRTKTVGGLGYSTQVFSTLDTGLRSSIANRHADGPLISAIICTIGSKPFTELLPALVADEQLHATIRANLKIVVRASEMTGSHWFLQALTVLRTFYRPSIIPELGTTDLIDVEGLPLAFCVGALFAAWRYPAPFCLLAQSASILPQPRLD